MEPGNSNHSYKFELPYITQIKSGLREIDYLGKNASKSIANKSLGSYTGAAEYALYMLIALPIFGATLFTVKIQ